jgi:protease-4
VGSILLFLLLFATCSGGVLHVLFRGPQLAEHSTLVIDLRAGLSLQKGVKGWLAGGQTPLADLQTVLTRARDDARIDDLVVLVANLEGGLGESSQIVALLDDFATSKKSIEMILQAESVDESEIYVSTAADTVYASPHMSFSWDGLASQRRFFHTLFDRLGIQPRFIAFKEYKSAIEPYLRDGFSAPARDNLEDLLTDLWAELSARLCERRNICGQRQAELVLRPLFGTDDALSQLGIIDAVATVQERLEDRETVSAEQYLRVVEHEEINRPRLAIVEARGAISIDGGTSMLASDELSAREIAAHLQLAAKDPNVAGIVLYVESPGGSVVASELIAQAVERVKERNLPIVVAMGSVAASGGYWISSDADAIVATPMTITGSIGVYFGSFAIENLMQKVGVSSDTVKTTPIADWQERTSGWTSDEEFALRHWVEQTYDSFVERVARGRGRSTSAIETVARGQVWSGKQALQHGLVDRVGSIVDAIAICNRLVQEHRSKRRGASEGDEVEQELLPASGFRGEPGWLSWLGHDLDLSRLKLLAQGLSLDLPRPDADAKMQAYLREANKPALWLIAPELSIR